MKTTLFYFQTTLFALLFLTACGGAGKHTKDDAILDEARKIHSEAIKSHNAVMKDLKEVAKLKAGLQDSLQKKAAKDSTMLKEKIANCETQEKAMKEWMANVQEVPAKEGEAHDHHDHEGHDHKPAPKISAEDMLAYQKEMKKSIDKIQQDVNAILKK